MGFNNLNGRVKSKECNIEKIRFQMILKEREGGRVKKKEEVRSRERERSSNNVSLKGVTEM